MVIAAVLNLGASFMSGGAGSGIVDFFHGFQVAIMMTVMLNLVQFVYWRCKLSRTGTCWQVHQPTLWTLLAAIMVNVQPMIILTIGSWKLCCNYCPDANPTCTSTGYSYPSWPNSPDTFRECPAPGGNVFWDVSYCSGGSYPVFPTVASGWAIQILCTWLGFVFMFVGVLQATQLHKKLARRWRTIRGANARSAAQRTSSA